MKQAITRDVTVNLFSNEYSRLHSLHLHRLNQLAKAKTDYELNCRECHIDSEIFSRAATDAHETQIERLSKTLLNYDQSVVAIQLSFRLNCAQQRTKLTQKLLKHQGLYEEVVSKIDREHAGILFSIKMTSEDSSSAQKICRELIEGAFIQNELAKKKAADLLAFELETARRQHRSDFAVEVGTLFINELDENRQININRAEAKAYENYVQSRKQDMSAYEEFMQKAEENFMQVVRDKCVRITSPPTQLTRAKTSAFELFDRCHRSLKVSCNKQNGGFDDDRLNSSAEPKKSPAVAVDSKNSYDGFFSSEQSNKVDNQDGLVSDCGLR